MADLIQIGPGTWERRDRIYAVTEYKPIVSTWFPWRNKSYRVEVHLVGKPGWIFYEEEARQCLEWLNAAGVITGGQRHA